MPFLTHSHNNTLPISKPFHNASDCENQVIFDDLHFPTSHLVVTIGSMLTYHDHFFACLLSAQENEHSITDKGHFVEIMRKTKN